MCEVKKEDRIKYQFISGRGGVEVDFQDTLMFDD